MQSLVEVHDEAQLEQALEVDAEIIGINNRDLRTFKTDLEVTERLAPAVPAGKIVVSESGVSSRENIDRVKAAGAHAVLVGEALVTAPDPGAKTQGASHDPTSVVPAKAGDLAEGRGLRFMRCVTRLPMSPCREKVRMRGVT